MPAQLAKERNLFLLSFAVLYLILFSKVNYSDTKGAFTERIQINKDYLKLPTAEHFLDEIADISTALQAKLLRVLENKRYSPWRCEGKKLMRALLADK